MVSIFIDFLRGLSPIFISFLSYLVCVISILIINRKFQLIGLCCYIILCGIIANIQVLYETDYLGFKVLLGTVIFSSTFLACDIIHDRYGEEKAIDAIYLNLFMNLFFLASMILALGHKPSSLEYSGSIEKIFTPAPRIILASYCAAFASQFSEIKLIKYCKNNIIAHNIALFISTIVIDNFVFILIAMYILSSAPFSFFEIFQITSMAILTRLICNFFNTIIFKKAIRGR